MGHRILRHCLSISLSFFILSPLILLGEGTKELNPNPGDVGGLQIWDNGVREFMTFGAPEDKRLNIHINEPGEIVHLGFRQDNNDVYFRVFDPDGNLVIDNGAGGGIPLPTAGNPGYIDTYNEAVAGPSNLDPAGYDPLTFTATKAGDYWIEFNPGDPVTINRQKRVFLYFDITVVNPSDPTIPQLGRLWSKEWDFSLLSFANRFNATMYIYASDGIVTSLDFNGIRPFGFTIGANNSGLYNTGDVEFDRKSRDGNIGYLQYKLFLNDPDSTAYPTGQFGKITAPISITGCDPDSRCINIEVDKAGTVEVVLDLNGVEGYQPGTTDLSIFTTVEVGANCIPWNSRDGNGDLVPGGAEVPITVNYYNGLTHLPLFDVENHDFGYIVELHRPKKSNVRPEMFWDDSELGQGSNLTGCNDVAGCHSYNYGDRRTINTWWYAEVLKDSADLQNNPIVLVDANTFIADAGNDTLVCLGTASLQMNGFVGGAPGGKWSSITGGSFGDVRDMNTDYVFTNDEIDNGLASLILTTDAFDECPQRIDTMNISFALAPEALAGNNQTICKNNPGITLAGAVNNADGGVWSSLGGTFADNTDLGTTYTPTQAEIDGGFTIITLTTSNLAGCPDDTDDLTIIFNDSPAPDAGDPQTICAGNDAALSGVRDGATSVLWSGGAGSFSPATNIDNPTYTPDQSEIDAGTFTLTYTVSRPGCLDESDQVVIDIDPAPTATVGPDINVCSNNPTASVTGSVTIASGGAWRSLGGGSFSTPNSLTTNFTADASDVTNTSVDLVFETTGNGDCISDSDTITLFFTPAPTVNPGTGQSLCSNNADVALNGSVTIASGGTWTSSGTGGSFVPNANNLTTTYIPSQSDIDNTSVVLTLTSTGNGNCSPVSESITINFTPEPTVDAGDPFSICANNPTGNLDASFTLAGGIEWSTTSGGTIGGINDPSSSYTLSAGEISAGIVTVTATTINNGNCNAVSDQVTINVEAAPTINAGGPQNICSNNADINLNATFLNATGVSWTTSGTGSFSNATVSNPTYSSSPADTLAGSITITATTTGNGICNAVSTPVTINYTSSPAINVENNISVCANNNPIVNGIEVNPSLANASGGTWATSGTGTFSPDASDFTASYFPSAADTTAGQITLTLTTTGVGNCNPVTENVTITFTDSPFPNAGPDISVCRDNPTVQLNGKVANATGGMWTQGTGTFSPSNTNLSTTYTPSITELDNETVRLRLVTSGNANCNPEVDFIRINITPVPTVDAGGDQTVCSTVSSIPLNGTVTQATGGQWATSGSGTFSNANALNTSYTPSAQDIIDGTLTLTLTSTGNGLCNSYSDNMTITFTSLPSVEAGNPITACDNAFPVQLNGSGSPSSWSGGLGTFSPSANVQNARYTPAPSEVGSTVTLTLSTNPSGGCPSISDQVTLNLLQGPDLDAVDDFTVCANDNVVNLSTTLGQASGVSWTTNGDGTFNSATSTSPIFTLSDDDKLQPEIEFYVQTTGNGSCTPSFDTVVVTITPEVEVFAGPDQTICGNTSTFALNGSITNATSGIWTTSGSGNFNPSATALATNYEPSAADLAGGFTLTLSSDAIGACPPISEDKIFTITPVPTANAGNDQLLCANVSQVAISGTVSTASGEWSTSGTGTFNNLSALTTFYTPSSADTAARSVVLTLETIGNGACPPTTSSITVDFDPVPYVQLPTDFDVCSNESNINITGNVFDAGGGQWNTFGDGTFGNSSQITTTYTPGASDIANGLVTLRLTSTGNGQCPSASDNINLFIDPEPVVNPGGDLTLCSDISTVNLVGNVQGATGGQWSTSGSGSFDNINNTNTFYTPSSNDLIAGVTLTLTSTGNGACAPVAEDLVISIDQKPVVDAGDPQTICADSTALTLDGTITNATGGIWSTSSTGNFGDVTVIDGQYFPSSSDLTGTEIKLFLTSTGNGACTPVEDSLLIDITPAPIIAAGSDRTLCANEVDIPLFGSIQNAGGVQWTSAGSGTFSNNTDPTSTYTPSAADTSARSVVLTLTSTGNGLCNAVNDQVQLFFQPAPLVDAGASQTICADVDQITLDGTVFNSGGMTWTNNGTGATTNKNTLTPTYFISAADKNNQQVKFYLSSTLSGLCPETTDSLTITITPAPSATADGDITICADTSGIAFTSNYTVGGNIRWESSGTGSFFPSNLVDEPTYVPSAGDITDSTLTIKFTTENMGSCLPVSDSFNLYINPAPTVAAGNDVEVCATQDYVDLNGVVTNAEYGVWTASGSGLLLENGENEINAYTLSDADRTAGTVSLTLTTAGNGLCRAVSENLLISIAPPPSVNAGQNKFVCADVDSVSLSGIVNNAGGNFWETYGQGSFFPNTSTESVRYIPSQSDRDQDSVLIALYPTGVDVCEQNPDFVTIYFSTTPFISAGDDSTYCSNSLPIALDGAGANGVWRGGTGTFSPDTTALNAIYTPSAAELTAGTVELRVHSTNNGSCVAAVDTVVFTLLDGPTLDIGNNHTVCADSTSLALNAVYTNAGGVSWSSFGTGTFEDILLDAPTYSFSTKDDSDSLVKIFATTTNNGVCIPASDTLKVFINPAPTIAAGFDQSICETTTSVNVSGNFTNAGGILWTTDGDGNFDNDISTSTAYNVLGNDVTNQPVELYITTTGNGLCKAVTDTIVVTIDPLHVIVSDDNMMVCEDATTVDLTANLTFATTGTWSTDGNGSFTPSANQPTTTYIPTNAESINGNTMEFIFTTNGNNACGSNTKSTLLSFTGAPTVDAGPDLFVCSNNPTTNLSGSFSGALGVEWTSTGGGTFGNDQSQVTTYDLSASEISAGAATLSLTTTGNGVCDPYTDVLVINVTSAPTVSAGPDITICADAKAINIAGNKTVAQGVTWSTLGTGTFTVIDELSTVYLPSSDDSLNMGVTLSIETTGNGLCNPVTADMTITFTPAPTIDAGNDTLICETHNSIDLTVDFDIAGGVTWTSSGTGSFSPNANTPNGTYNISNNDVNNGFIGLTATTIDNGTCQPVSDFKTVTLSPAPSLDLPADFIVCETAASIDLNGTVENATDITWTSSGTGAFTSNASSAIYEPTSNDTDAGIINFIATSTGNGVCDPTTDNVRVSFQEIPVVNAGPDQLICAVNNGISLNATILNAGGGEWTSNNGTGGFASANSLITTYSSTNADTTLGVIDLILTSTSNGVCEAEDDTVTVTFRSAPYITIDPVLVCEDVSDFTLNAEVFHAAGGSWSFNGAGGLTPHNADLNATYFIAPADIINGSVNFTLTTTGNGVCSATTKNLTATIAPLPDVDAGDDQVVCINTLATLQTSIAPNQTYQWFDANDISISNEFIATPAVSNNTYFYVVVTTNASCVASDTVNTDVVAPPTLNMVDNVCLEDDLIVDAAPIGVPTGGRFQWFYNNQYLFNVDDSTSIQAPAKGTYKVVFSIANCTVTGNTNVNQPVPFNVDSIDYCASLDGSVVLDAGPASRYQWHATGNTSRYQTAFFEGYYHFTIYDQFGCQENDSIKVYSVCEPQVYVPSGMIPGNPNKQFGVTGKDFTNYMLMVFNRWGEMIYYSEDPNETWDGMYKGEPVPIGVYPWTVKYEGLTERFKGPYDQTGKLQVIR